MEITLPLFSVLSKLIRKFIPSNAVAFFAIILFSFIYTNAEAQITNLQSDLNPACVGATINFTATVTGAGNVTFYDGAAIPANQIGTPIAVAGGTAVLPFAGLAAGTHTITGVFDGDGSTQTLTGQVVNDLPVVTAAPNPPPTVCSGVPFTTINLNSSIGGTAFNWVRDNTTNLIGMDPTGPGGTTTIPGALTNITTTQQQSVFTIVGVANGCTSAGVNVTVTVNPPPTVAAIAGPTSVCQGSPITLTDATGGVTTSWSSNNTGVATVTNAGVVSGVGTGTAVITYSVTDGNGCQNSTTYSVSVGPAPPVATATANPTTICVPGTSQISATIPGTAATVCQTNSQQAGFRQGGGDLDRTVTIAGIPAGATITGITLTVNASHQRDNEVEMYLIAPGGTLNPGPNGIYQHTSVAGGSITLEGNKGGNTANGVNYVNTVFSDLGGNTLATECRGRSLYRHFSSPQATHLHQLLPQQRIQLT